MAGYKTWAVGEEVLAADFNSYLQSQVVARFANASTRTAQLPAPGLNQLSALDTNPGRVDYWNGSAWATLTDNDLGYGERATTLAIGAGGESTTVSLASTGAIAVDGRPVVVEFFEPSVTLPAGVGSALSVWLYQDSVSLGRVATAMNVVAGQGLVSMGGKRRFTPVAGTHTYTAGAACSAGSGSVTAQAGGVGLIVPAFIRVSRA